MGLMTGDVTINPNASCLVMTTEILRSMLYNGSEIVREVRLLILNDSNLRSLPLSCNTPWHCLVVQLPR